MKLLLLLIALTVTQIFAQCTSENTTDPSSWCSDQGYCVGTSSTGFACSCFSGYGDNTGNCDASLYTCTAQEVFSYVSDLTTTLSADLKFTALQIHVDAPIQETIKDNTNNYATVTRIHVGGTGSCNYPEGSVMTWEKSLTPAPSSFPCEERYSGDIDFMNMSKCLTVSCFDDNNNTIGCTPDQCTVAPCYKEYISDIVIQRSYQKTAGRLSLETLAQNSHFISIITPWIDNCIDCPLTVRACPDVTANYILSSLVYNELTGNWEVIVDTSLLSPWKLAMKNGGFNGFPVTLTDVNCPFGAQTCTQKLTFEIPECQSLEDALLLHSTNLYYQCNADTGCAGIINVTSPCTTTGCTRTQGYWKNHFSTAKAPGLQVDWPISETTSMCGETWLSIFDQPAKTNWLSLAHQYMAAYLNQANGASTTELEAALGISLATIENELKADCFSADKNSTWISWKDTLDLFNNGNLPNGPPHCDYDGVCTPGTVLKNLTDCEIDLAIVMQATQNCAVVKESIQSVNYECVTFEDPEYSIEQTDFLYQTGQKAYFKIFSYSTGAQVSSVNIVEILNLTCTIHSTGCSLLSLANIETCPTNTSTAACFYYNVQDLLDPLGDGESKDVYLQVSVEVTFGSGKREIKRAILQTSSKNNVIAGLSVKNQPQDSDSISSGLIFFNVDHFGSTSFLVNK